MLCARALSQEDGEDEDSDDDDSDDEEGGSPEAQWAAAIKKGIKDKGGKMSLSAAGGIPKPPGMPKTKVSLGVQ